MSLSPIERETIAAALQCFVEGELGRGLTTRLFDLGGALIAYGGASRWDAARAVIHIQDKLDRYAVLAERLRYSKAEHDAAKIDEWTLLTHMAVDVEGMLVAARSAMDHLAVLLSELAEKRRQLPPSFRVLREQIDRYEAKLLPGVASLIRDAKWFEGVRRARDGVVHDGAQTVVLPPIEGRLAFQVLGRGNDGLINEPSLMRNAFIVDTQRYLTMTFANWIVLLDRIGELLRPLVSGADARRSSIAYSPAYSVLRNWIQELAVAGEVNVE